MAQSLAELVERALASEPSVLAARSDLTAAEARYDQRASALWPQVDTSDERKIVKTTVAACQ
jgi:outer membrane protein TolC